MPVSSAVRGGVSHCGGLGVCEREGGRTGAPYVLQGGGRASGGGGREADNVLSETVLPVAQVGGPINVSPCCCQVSMLSAEFFQQMEAKLREIRGVGKPAGGLQLVMCGDFFQ